MNLKTKNILKQVCSFNLYSVMHGGLQALSDIDEFELCHAHVRKNCDFIVKETEA